MAHTKLTARKRTIVMPTRRMRFTLGKSVPPHLVEALRDMEEDPMEEPMDEEAKEEPMFEEPLEIEDFDEEPMEEDEQEEE